MNRLILFRGKRLDNGEWVYGSLVRMLVDGRIATCICSVEEVGRGNKDVPSMGILYTLNKDIFMVDPATVGEYTGLIDKNGNKIFEDDILISENIMHKIVWNNEWAKFQAISESIYSPSSLNQEWINMYGKVVIGNIHDNNPELLKENK